jgi:hypothetical protein
MIGRVHEEDERRVPKQLVLQWTRQKEKKVHTKRMLFPRNMLRWDNRNHDSDAGADEDDNMVSKNKNHPADNLLAYVQHHVTSSSSPADILPCMHLALAAKDFFMLPSKTTNAASSILQWNMAASTATSATTATTSADMTTKTIPHPLTRQDASLPAHHRLLHRPCSGHRTQPSHSIARFFQGAYETHKNEHETTTTTRQIVATPTPTTIANSNRDNDEKGPSLPQGSQAHVMTQEEHEVFRANVIEPLSRDDLAQVKDSIRMDHTVNKEGVQGMPSSVWHMPNVQTKTKPVLSSTRPTRKFHARGRERRMTSAQLPSLWPSTVVSKERMLSSSSSLSSSSWWWCEQCEAPVMTTLVRHRVDVHHDNDDNEGNEDEKKVDTTEVSLHDASSPSGIETSVSVSPYLHGDNHAVSTTTVIRENCRDRMHQDTVCNNKAWFCEKCGAYIATTKAEHADFHVALSMSTAWNDDQQHHQDINSTSSRKQMQAASCALSRRKKHKTATGPMDAYMVLKR